jgi:hypothetical protein
MPRITVVFVCASLAAVVLNLISPKWVVPMMLITMGPLGVFWRDYSIKIGSYPLNLPSLGIWASVFWWSVRVRRPFEGTWLTRFGVDPGLFFQCLLVACSVPALVVSSWNPAAAVVTRIFVVAGVVEPLLAYIIIRSWLDHYQDRNLLIYALFVSLTVSWGAALAMELATFSLVQILQTNRASGFGGANHVGLIIALVYPLSYLLRLGRQASSKVGVVASYGPVVFCWVLALVTQSRATPVVMALQTAALLLWHQTRRRVWWIVLVALPTVATLVYFAPAEARVAWLDRFSQTDLVGYFLGNPSRVHLGDALRRYDQTRLLSEIVSRPAGGYGATNTEDPENLYMDTALQLGWVPAIVLLSLHAYLLWRSFRGTHSGSGLVPTGNQVFFCIFLGAVLYSAATGANVCKVDVFGGIISYSAPCPTIFAAVMALALSSPFQARSQLKSRTVPSGPAKPVSL